MATKIVPTEGLNPCPFCGGKPVVKRGATTFADCQGCGAILFGKGVDDLKEKWNRRTIKAPLSVSTAGTRSPFANGGALWPLLNK